MWFTLAVLIVLAALAFIAQPFFRGWRRIPDDVGPGADPGRELLAEKEAMYAALKDLDFEYRTGKLSDEDYAELQEGYRARALNILSAADHLEGAARLAAPDGAVGCPRCAHGNAPGSKFCEACGARVTGQAACPACGAAVAAGDRFCGECGARVGGGISVPVGAIPALQGGESHDA